MGFRGYLDDVYGESSYENDKKQGKRNIMKGSNRIFQCYIKKETFYYQTLTHFQLGNLYMMIWKTLST